MEGEETDRQTEGRKRGGGGGGGGKSKREAEGLNSKEKERERGAHRRDSQLSPLHWQLEIFSLSLLLCY